MLILKTNWQYSSLLVQKFSNPLPSWVSVPIELVRYKLCMRPAVRNEDTAHWAWRRAHGTFESCFDQLIFLLLLQ